MVRKLVVSAAALLLAVAIAPAARAQNMQKELILTVNAPVVLPTGILNPGTYDLRFIDPGYSIVALSREDGSAVGQYRVIPATRSSYDGDTEVVVGNLPDGSTAIMKWFYAGERSGYQFIYAPSMRLMAQKQAHSVVPAK